MKSPPKLPNVMRNVLPGEHAGAGTWKTTRPAAVYDSWEPDRKQIASLDINAMIEVTNGAVIVDRPDVIRVTKPITSLNLDPGDTIFRYAYYGEGEADLWAKGCWYPEADGGFITEVDGGGCGGERCAAKVTEPGKKTWWLHVRLPDGKEGWSLREDLEPVNQ